MTKWGNRIGENIQITYLYRSKHNSFTCVVSRRLSCVMTSLDAKISSAQSWLAGRHILVDDEWLTGCVEYLSNAVENYSQQDINQMAQEQWLLNDLKDVCPGSLPPGLSTSAKIHLTGRYVLQVNCAFDVGTPAYQQYQKLKKVNIENIEATITNEEKINNHRMIKLFMTDGVQEVYGIEYRTMRNLSCDITPGCKVLIKGPVDCRRGTLLLQEHNFEILGGEVGDLLTTNCLPAMLNRLLGVNDAHVRARPPAQQPALTQTTAPQLNPTSNTSSGSLHHSISSATQAQQPLVNVNPISMSQRRSFEWPSPNQAGSFARPVAVVTGVPVADTFDDDIDLDQIAAIEEQFTNPKPSKRPSTPDRRSSVEKRLKMSDRTISLMDTQKKVNVATSKLSNQISIERYTKHLPRSATEITNDTMERYTIKDPPDRSSEFPDEKDLFRDEFHDIFEEPQVVYPIEVSSEPFVYIKQINQMSNVAKEGKIFHIKAQILKLLSKLSLGKEGWSLRCTLVDGTGCLDVDFTSRVLTKLVGYSPSEMTTMKREMANNPEVKQRALAALDAAKTSLQVLNCIVEVTCCGTPRITELIPFSERHAKLLSDRLRAANL